MNTPLLTLGQAVKHVKCSKATLSKALNKGTLSGTRQSDGSWRIDPAELMRWDGERSTRGQQIATRTPMETPAEPQVNTPDNSALQARLEVTEGRLADAQATIEDLRARLDAEQEERRALVQRFLPAPEPVAPQPRRRGFLGWFAGANP